MQCFLDLDGVLANFVKGMCIHHAKPNPYTNKANVGVWDFYKLWGMTADDLWKWAGYSFWVGLEPMPDAQKIVSIVKTAFGMENILVVSPLGPNARCYDGKRDWLARWFPELANRLTACSHKHLLAAPNKVLIDDYDRNIAEFAASGGNAILLPRLWNRGHAFEQQASNCLEDRIKELPR